MTRRRAREVIRPAARSRRSRALAAALLAVALIGGIVGATKRERHATPRGVLGAEAAMRVVDKVGNGSFERSLAGWRAASGRASSIRGGRAGARAAFVRADPRTRRSALVTTARVTAVAEEVQATAAVRVPRGSGRVCVVVRAGVASDRKCVRVTTRWRDLPLARIRPSGAQVVELRIESRGDIVVDHVRLLQLTTPPPDEGVASLPPLAAAPPPPEAPFRTLPPGSPLPSAEECARNIRRAPETRPQNAAENKYVMPPMRVREMNGPNYTVVGGQKEFPAAVVALMNRIDGRFTGTTDEILQWGSCKWGFDEDITRARAVVESTWDMDENGDAGLSWGILQIKVTHPETFPYSRDSTAFNVDYSLAWLRACYEGYMNWWLPESARGDEWGCVGLWYSGQWQSNWDAYLDRVRLHLNLRTWRRF